MPISICYDVLSILRVISDYLTLFGGCFTKFFFKKNLFVIVIEITLSKLSKVETAIKALTVLPK